jgi:peptidoglycan hydrolase-like protein with peptidoglycan-binding domain
MNQLYKRITTTALIVAMVMPAFASATTTTTTATNVAAMLTQLQATQAQITALQTQQKGTLQTLLRTLKEGISGDDVTMLQALLASDPSIYPEGKITGFYGKLTAQAVKRFQKKHGFEQVGNVGPKTLKKLQELLKENPLEVRDVDEDDDDDGDDRRGRDNKKGLGTTTARVICHKVPPGHMIAQGWLKKNDGKTPLVPDCQTLPGGIKKKLEGGTTTPDTIAPVISAITTSAITTNSAVVTWTTNEAATSWVYVGTVNPASVASSTLVQVSGLTLAHSVSLTGLTNGTTYYMLVASTDAAGNTTTSAQVSFTTAVTPDTTAPTISAVTTSAVATTTATVSWTTNESATGHVYVGTVNPVVVASSTVVTAGTAATSQSVILSGLTASTTYFYVVDAKDASNNVSTSAQQSFTTTN